VRRPLSILGLAALLGCGGGELPYASDGASGQAGAGVGGSAGVGGNSGAAGEAGSGGSGQAGSGGSGQAGSGGSGQAGEAGQAGAGAGGEAGAAGSGGATPGPKTLCQGSEQAFVRRAIQAVLGRKPYGQAEVQLYLDLIGQVDKIAGVEGPAGALRPGRRVAVSAMMGREEFLFRWIDAYRDFLRVQRTEDMANPGCYGMTMRADGGAIAEMIRDQPPDTEAGDGKGAFTMRDVLLSSLKLDDVSPAYIANLFSMVVLTYPGANAAPDKLELSRRSDFGAWFGGVYLRRDPVCLRCHNGEFSVTYSDEPDKNRHFAVPGFLEEALLGASTGPDGDEKSDGPTRMYASLRHDGFVNGGSARPWGWTEACGQFAARDAVPPDIAGIDARFGNLRGDRTSPWDLASSLQDGFRKLRDHGLSRGPNGLIPDPNEAFAYLVVLNIVEQVWREITGTPLTIATSFPRNAAARDQLLLLAEGFVASGFSHRELVLQVLASPYFNLAPLEDTCWETPYDLPALFDPWTTAEQDPEKRRNSPADALVPASPRATLHAAYRALGWPNPPQSSFPDRFGEEGEFQASVGVFLKNAEPGFRGLDFQGRLGWESRFGSCTPPPFATSPDFVDELIERAKQRPDATVRDLVIALKDRLTGEAFLADAAEQEAIEAILGVKIDSPASTLTEQAAPLRRVCGVLLASPQFLLLGTVPPDQLTIPALTPASTGYKALCEQLKTTGLPAGLQASCEGAGLTVSAP
jgi:hypothetical protein